MYTDLPLSDQFCDLDHHSLLWTKATSFMKLKGGYLWQEGAIVHCDQSPQHLNGHSGYNSGQLVHLTYYWVN